MSFDALKQGDWSRERNARVVGRTAWRRGWWCWIVGTVVQRFSGAV